VNQPAKDPAYAAETSGHGENEHRGRSVLGDAATQRDFPGVIAAMQRLLALVDVQAHSRMNSLDGRRVHHLEAGSGPPLVLLHGACGGAANWYRMMGSLARSHRVLALDFPGFGLSEAVEPKPPLGAQMAALVQRWLDLLGIAQADLVGTSFGGLAALRLAQVAPNRVRRVAVIDSVGLGRTLPLSLRLASLPPFSAVALKPSRFGMRWQFHELMVAQGTQLPVDHVSALLEYLWQSAAACSVRELARAFSMFSDLGGQREVLTDNELRAFPARLLIIWGERDRFLPVVHAQHAAALVPRALCRIIPRAGHSPNWEAPEAVLGCLSVFLRGDLTR
jgi:pimeloyl-ACP methyl ester carboxylesterase